jgi:hypothetical protein
MENFEEYMVDMMNKAATALMLSVGHRTKLFDSMKDCTPVTSQQLADKSNLNERYVREWLGAMVTGKIVDYYPSNKSYSLSEDKAKLLCDGGSYNYASSMQWVPALAYVEDEIVKCGRRCTIRVLSPISYRNGRRKQPNHITCPN